MALGTLSADQQAFRDAVVAATGLDPTLVTAWIGSESGWGVTKANHNYLNVRAGSDGWRSYTSAEQAGANVGSLLNSSHYYAGVRAAIPAGPAAQAEAIQASPWDAGHYAGHRLLDTLRSLAGGKSSTTNAELADIHVPGTPWDVPFPGPDVNPAAPLGWAGGLFKSIGSAVAKDTLAVGLTLVFTAAALGLIGFGLYTLVGSTSAGQTAKEAVGTATQVAALAAV